MNKEEINEQIERLETELIKLKELVESDHIMKWKEFRSEIVIDKKSELETEVRELSEYFKAPFNKTFTFLLNVGVKSIKEHLEYCDFHI